MEKTSTPRVDKMRKEREALGIKRRDVYVHDDDWPLVRQYARTLQKRRMRGKREEDNRRLIAIHRKFCYSHSTVNRRP